MEGLRGAILRSDLPTPAHVLALRKNDQRHVLALPVLAGLELSTSSELLRLDPDQARLAVAFFLAERRSFPGPDWLRPLVETHANVAAGRDCAFRNDGDAPWRAPYSLCPRVVGLRVAAGYGSGGMSKVAERLSRARAAAHV